MIYSSSNNAAQHNLSDQNKLTAINAGRMGYFRKIDLSTHLLSKTDCVGIRFYNVVKNGNSLIASAARADGSEDTSTYLLSQGPSPALVMNRSIAVGHANPYNSNSYMSFFSRDVLTEIITNNIHSGICLYQTSLSGVDITTLESNQTELRSLHLNDNDGFNALKTHLIAPVTPDAMGQILPLSNQDINRVSIHPCPGHCVRSGNIDTTPPDSMNNASDPYLFEWTAVKI